MKAIERRRESRYKAGKRDWIAGKQECRNGRNGRNGSGCGMDRKGKERKGGGSEEDSRESEEDSSGKRKRKKEMRRERREHDEKKRGSDWSYEYPN